MTGFKLSSDGDIDVDNSGKMLLLSTFQELVQQRLSIKLKTYKGEWWLDTTFGIPYRDTGDGKAIIGKGFTKADIDALYISAIREDSDVQSIEYFRTEYNPIFRTYSLSFEVKTVDALLNSSNAGLQAWEEIEYTYNPSLLSSSCNIDFNDWVLNIHPVVHTYLPYGPTFGWLGSLDIGVNSFGGTNTYVVDGYVLDGYVI